MDPFRLRPLARAAALACALVAAATTGATADLILSDSLTGNTPAGADAATDSTFLAIGFGTDASNYALSTATLLLSTPNAGQAEVDLYADDGSTEPGALLGTLTTTGTLSSVASPLTYDAIGLDLAPNSTYWIVLKATTGEVDWSWSTDGNSGGLGYLGLYGNTDPSGSIWFINGPDPAIGLVGSPYEALVTAAVPEPASIVLAGSGAACWLAYVARRRRSRSRKSGL